MKKKFLSIIAIALTASLFSCGNGGQSTDGSSSTVDSSTTVSSSSTGGDSSSSVASSTTAEVIVTFGLELTAPTKVAYEVGETFDATGLAVTLVTYRDDVATERKVLDEDAYDILLNNESVIGHVFTADEIGNLEIQVALKDGSATPVSFSLSVHEKEKVITKSLSVTGPTKTAYRVGEVFDKSGLMVKLFTITDGVSDSGVNLIDYELKKEDGQSLIDYEFTEDDIGEVKVILHVDEEGVEDYTFTLTVQASTIVKSLEVTKPTKVTYTVGDKFDPTGMVVKLVTTTNGVSDGGKVLNPGEYYLMTPDGVSLINFDTFEIDYTFAEEDVGTFTCMVAVEGVEDFPMFELTVKALTVGYSISTTGFSADDLKVTFFTLDDSNKEVVIDDLTNVPAGTEVHFRVEDGESDGTYYIDKYDQLSLLDANGNKLSASLTYDENDVKNVLHFTMPEEDVVLKIDPSSDQEYKDKEFIGSYAGYNTLNDYYGSNQYISYVTAEVTSAGNVVIEMNNNTYTIPYTTEASGMSLYEDRVFKANNSYAKYNDFATYKNGVMFFYFHVDYSTDYLLVLVKNAKSVTRKNHFVKDDDYDNLTLDQIDVDGEERWILNYYVGELYDDVNVVGNGDTLDESTALTLTNKDGGGFKIGSSTASTPLYLSTDSDHHIAKTSIGTENGEYANADATQTLKLDGFGKATLTEGETVTKGTYTYTNGTVNVTWSDGSTCAYSLNLTDKTFAVKTLIQVDPFTSSTTFKSKSGTSMTLVLENGKGKLTCDSLDASSSSVTYTVKDSILTFTYEYNDYDSWDSYDYTFTFDISSDLSTLTLTKKVTGEGSGYSWGLPSFSSGYTLVKQ